MYLNTNVTSTRRFLACAVAQSCQVVDGIGITAPALCNGVGGVVESKGSLELTDTNLYLLVFAPFGVKIKQLYGGFARSLDVGTLNLHAPVKVADLAFQNETCIAQVERVGLGILLVSAYVLHHTIAAEIDVFNPLRNLNGACRLLTACSADVSLCVGRQCNDCKSNCNDFLHIYMVLFF